MQIFENHNLVYFYLMMLDAEFRFMTTHYTTIQHFKSNTIHAYSMLYQGNIIYENKHVQFTIQTMLDYLILILSNLQT